MTRIKLSNVDANIIANMLNSRINSVKHYGNFNSNMRRGILKIKWISANLLCTILKVVIITVLHFLQSARSALKGLINTVLIEFENQNENENAFSLFCRYVYIGIVYGINCRC